MDREAQESTPQSPAGLASRAPLHIPWEVGSEFHWAPLLHAESDPLFTPSERLLLFATARSAMSALRPLLRTGSSRPRLLLPAYFCMEVATSLSREYDVDFYIDDPRQPEPEWDSLTPRQGDCVLVNNTFGVRTSGRWPEFYQQHPDATFIEDHSHDPTSHWARTSEASYCFSSIRKTIPLPDGAPLWSPRGLPLPTLPRKETIAGHQKLAAMLLKASYLEGIPVLKAEFRSLQVAGEEGLGTEAVRQASSITRALLPFMDVDLLRRARAANARHVVARLTDSRGRVSPLFTDWPDDACPFNAVVTCATRADRDALQRYLADHNVYAPVHWDLLRGRIHPDDEQSHHLSERILTIPTDYRYTIETIDRVCDLLLQWAAD